MTRTPYESKVNFIFGEVALHVSAPKTFRFPPKLWKDEIQYGFRGKKLLEKRLVLAAQRAHTRNISYSRQMGTLGGLSYGIF